MAIASTNPATGQVMKTFAALGSSEIESKLAAAARAFPQWSAAGFARRAACLRRAADILEAERDRLGGLAVAEMGKPLRQAFAEVEKCAWACRHYAEHAQAMLADEPVATDAATSYVRYEPLGIILAVMPWNFPFWQVFRFAAPALMAGNVGLLKHASNVPQCALAIEDVLARAGLVAGAFQTLLVGAAAIDAIIDDPRIAAVTLTGSEPAGRSVAARAANKVKKAVLELGGSDPFIVLPSADLAASVETAVTARNINNGQSCIAAKRFIVAESIAPQFEREIVERFQRLAVGDPTDPKTDIGPLASEGGLRTLEDQVGRLVRAGSTILTGGRRISRPGFYFEPTVVAGIDPHRPEAQEEVFGPVALMFRVRDVEEAIELANSTNFGLGASAWTNDRVEQEKLIARLEAGSVFINGMVKSDPRLPFGGIKHSGFGRELGTLGIREFVNAKTVWIGPVHA